MKGPASWAAGVRRGFAAGVAKMGATLGVFVPPILKSELGIPIVLGAMVGVNVLGFLVTAILAHGGPEGGGPVKGLFSQASKGGVMIQQDFLDIFRLPPGKKVRLKDHDTGWAQTKELK